MLKLAVVGNPIFHSRSPLIFNNLSKDSGIQLHYNRISCDLIKDAIDFSRDIKINGLNITSPFKKTVIDYVNKLDYQATNINSANTILFSEDKVEGYNTDYFGVLRTIWDNSLIFNKKKVLILGAGAAAQTAAFAIRNLNSLLYIWDRNEEKSEKVAEDIGIDAISSKEVVNQISSFDYIVSTIPSNSKILGELNFFSNQIIFDTIYHNSFFEANQPKYGYRVIKGENWLINQALLAFEYFTSQKAISENIFKLLNDLNKKIPNTFILTGFSGSGKTTFGELISKELYCNFIDLDKVIEEKTHTSISEIFSEMGEKAFRRYETETLRKVKEDLDNQNELTILSVGGGIYENEENLKILNEIGKIIWIYSPFEACYSRISYNFTRPLIQNKENAKTLFDLRKDQYFFNSEFVFLNMNGIESGVQRLVTEISRII